MALATFFSHSTPGTPTRDASRLAANPWSRVTGMQRAISNRCSVSTAADRDPLREFDKLVWRPAEAEGLVLQNDSWVACGG
jgi:hypothetical protein